MLINFSVFTFRVLTLYLYIYTRVVPKVSVLIFYLNVYWTHLKITSYLLQSMTHGKLHSGSNVFSTEHNSTGSHFP